MFFGLWNQLKMSVFTSITSQINFVIAHHVSETLKVMFAVKLQYQ